MGAITNPSSTAYLSAEPPPAGALARLRCRLVPSEEDALILVGVALIHWTLRTLRREARVAAAQPGR